MKPVMQSETDDCLRACVASVLDLHPGEVPHFVAESGLDSWSAVLSWLGERGMDLEIHYDKDPGCVCIAAGNGPRGRRHAVVWMNGLLHDPHSSGAGLDGKPDYYATINEVEART